MSSGHITTVPTCGIRLRRCGGKSNVLNSHKKSCLAISRMHEVFLSRCNYRGYRVFSSYRHAWTISNFHFWYLIHTSAASVIHLSGNIVMSSGHITTVLIRLCLGRLCSMDIPVYLCRFPFSSGHNMVRLCFIKLCSKFFFFALIYIVARLCFGKLCSRVSPSIFFF